MHIEVDTPDRLVVTHRPVTLSVVLAGVILMQVWVALGFKGNWFGTVGMLLGALVATVLAGVLIRHIDLILDRRAVEALLPSATLFRKDRTRLPLSEVTGAHVRQAFSRNGTHTHRPALSLSGGCVQLLTPSLAHSTALGQVTAAITRRLAR